VLSSKADASVVVRFMKSPPWWVRLAPHSFKAVRHISSFFKGSELRGETQ
jgi:hypothetical protein